VSIIKFENGAVGKVASIIDSYQPYHLRVHLVGSDGAIVDGKYWSTRWPGDPDRVERARLETSADVVHPYSSNSGPSSAPLTTSHAPRGLRRPRGSVRADLQRTSQARATGSPGRLDDIAR
jgi:hypothetical protein